ncbi:Las1-like-domain-containing protein [Xylaria sp. FL0064]|nr:Las1-like-domain-containing protein [Xylaria sp. FL0064]
MATYIHTPWRDEEELLRVRQQFYPSSSPSSIHASAKPNTPTTAHHNHNHIHDHRNSNENADGTHAALAIVLDAERRQQQAVSRVSMWMQRGGCPHLVESTALLTAAILSDLHESRTKANSSSYAIRAAYSAAFSRFVTGLLDGQQDKLRKISMYSIAKNIGLPATFVELRHQATHEQLPSLAKLRSAANKALAWIWNFYWKDLATVNKGNSKDDSPSNSQRDQLLRYLREQDETLETIFQKELKSWEETSLLQTLADIAESSEEPQVILRALQLSHTVLNGGSHMPSKVASETLRQTKDLEAVRVELQTLNEELENTRVQRVERPLEASDEVANQSTGWTRYQGTWTPKPIGVV